MCAAGQHAMCSGTHCECPTCHAARCEPLEFSAHRRRILDDWLWSQAIAPAPLPLCLVTGI